MFAEATIEAETGDSFSQHDTENPIRVLLSLVPACVSVQMAPRPFVSGSVRRYLALMRRDTSFADVVIRPQRAKEFYACDRIRAPFFPRTLAAFYRHYLFGEVTLPRGDFN